MLRQSINQRRKAVRVVAIQIDIFDLRLKLGKGKIQNAAQGEIVFDLRAILRPLHVSRLSLHFSRAQIK